MRLSRLRSVGRGLVVWVGPAEAVLVVGLGLVTAALWPSWGRLALLPSGLVLVWLALPARTGFVVPPAEKARRS